MKVAPYGSWVSPLSAEALTRATRSLSEARLVGDWLYWLESVPAERGRVTIMRARADAPESARVLVPEPFSVRSRVHEYGGGAYCVGEYSVLFSSFKDGALIEIRDGALRPIVALEGWRFADLNLHPEGRSVAAVAEIHAAARDPENRLVRIDLDTGAISTLARGADFYAAPRFSPDGRSLAWVSWHHPNMPWDETELWLGTFRADGSLDARRIDCGASITQPAWSPSGKTLFWITDASGYWNPAAYSAGEIRRLPPDAAEYAGPAWSLASRTYCPLDDETLIAQRIVNADAELVRVSFDGARERIETGYSGYGSIGVENGRLVFIGAAAERLPELVVADLEGHPRAVVRTAGEVPMAAEEVSHARAIEFESADGSTAHAFFYPPTNPRFRGRDGERPPLVVMTHGGPTAMASPTFNPRVQFFTSRGWAVLDVNYGGSTGFGTAYRNRLKGQWGVVDVADCEAAVRFVCEQGLADAERVAIRGGSAGGYTTLAALAFSDVFKAGASHYGIGDLAALARDTHKFESRYTDSLVGPYPEAEALYEARSALSHCEDFSCPVVFFQGTEDAIVPPNQSETMAAALRERGVPVALVLFEGEGHGFRVPENARQAIEQEYAFLCRAFGIRPAEDFSLPLIANAEALPPLG